ncbi:MAG: alpha-ribazole phosphatase family protein [Ketobacteraceae bacterium]|nr:alpha-ribazole phosphatase family protein [Ketobacteraceae bacterium]
MQPVFNPSEKTVIDMLRHGEPEGGVKYRGSLDDPLSETGWQQMSACLEQCKTLGYAWDRIIASPMQRCLAFAEQTATKMELPLTIVGSLRELCFGDLEGLRPRDAWEQYPELLSDMWRDPARHTPPNGESFVDFAARVNTAINQLLADHGGERLLLVVHGGVVRAALHKLIEIPPSSTFRFDIPYASMTRFKVYRNSDNTYESALSFVNGVPAT